MRLRKKYWHEFFIIGIVIKSLTGLVETLSGFVLLLISPGLLINILGRLSHGGQIVVCATIFCWVTPINICNT